MPGSTLWVVFITLLYPLAIGLGQGQVEPRFAAGFLVLVGLTRLHALKISAWGRWWLGGTSLLFLVAVWSNVWLPLKLYPVFVNAALLAIFSYSLIYPPSIIEHFARLRDPDLPAQAIAYTRRVTQVWFVFFAINGAFSLMTALWASPAIWTLYNGVIAYLMMGFLFAGEYVARWHFKRQLNA